ncbi:MAG: hypothetical protein EBW14_01740 [Oxalobacteraceae bacterium]|jgi:hypothetical protein|nr:hypothetical protein [Oxalobacteraceae bacterium]
METTNETVVPAHYNPNQLVTYKVIDLDATDQTISYPTVKVTDIEWELEQKRYNTKNLAQYISRVNDLENRLPDYLEMDSEEIIADICSIFGFNPTKQVEFEATARITGTVDVPLADLKDFDIDSIDLYVTVDSYAYNIDVDAEIEDLTRTD